MKRGDRLIVKANNKTKMEEFYPMNDLESIAQAVVLYIYRNYREKGNRYLLNHFYLSHLICDAGFDELFQEGKKGLPGWKGDEASFYELLKYIHENWRKVMLYVNEKDEAIPQ